MSEANAQFGGVIYRRRDVPVQSFAASYPYTYPLIPSSCLAFLSILQIGSLPALANLNVADNALEELPPTLADLKEKKIKELKLLPNPIADKKVRASCVQWTFPASSCVFHSSCKSIAASDESTTYPSPNALFLIIIFTARCRCSRSSTATGPRRW